MAAILQRYQTQLKCDALQRFEIKRENDEPTLHFSNCAVD